MASDAPLDPRSAVFVGDLLSQIASDGTWINTYAYSTPVFTVPANQPTVPITLDAGFSTAMQALQQTWTAVPIPANTQPASGTDAHMVIWQPATDTMWEFWQMHHEPDGWHAAWGGTIYRLSTNPGYYTAPQPTWGATATSLPLLGGLIRPSELAAGHIDHALSIGIPQAQAQYFAWLAQRTDGSIYSPTAIPEGQRFRLDPHLNLNNIPMAPIIKMIAVAAQKYGIIVRDQAGAVTFYAEDTDAERPPRPLLRPPRLLPKPIHQQPPQKLPLDPPPSPQRQPHLLLAQLILVLAARPCRETIRFRIRLSSRAKPIARFRVLLGVCI